MKIAPEITAILDGCRLEVDPLIGSALYLPTQLDRKLYEGVNKVLVALGGKWNKHCKAHEFAGDITDRWDDVLQSGEVVDAKKELQAFYTPRDLALEVARMADLEDGMDVLEPSAGTGRLIVAAMLEARALEFCAIDVNPEVRVPLLALNNTLRRCGTCKVHVQIQDFIPFSALNSDREELRFDRVLMNPPFSKQQDIDHVLAAWRWLKKGGILVAIMSPGWMFRENRKSKDFREFLALFDAKVVDVDAGTFKEEGTMIRTVIVKIKKPVVAPVASRGREVAVKA